jgi:hypothetical protein
MAPVTVVVDPEDSPKCANAVNSGEAGGRVMHERRAMLAQDNAKCGIKRASPCPGR